MPSEEKGQSIYKLTDTLTDIVLNDMKKVNDDSG